jgi:hypothetical protein
MRIWWPTLACVAALSAFTASSAAARYRPPRLEDGHPDLQGVWDHVDATSLERPPGIATLTITAEQAAAITRAREQIVEDRSKPTEPAATVIERITRVADDELSYLFTVDDPANYTQPWTGETHLTKKDEDLLEFACHEANYSLRFILQGGRARDSE